MAWRQFITILLCASMVLAAGCAGWGEDGSDNPEPETDGNGEGQAEEVSPPDAPTPTDEGPETDSGSSGDSSSTSESSSSSASAASSSSTSDSSESDEGNEGDDSGDAGEEGDEDDGEEEEETKTADMRVYAEDKQSGEYIEGVTITIENRETGKTYTGTTAEGNEFNGTYHNFEDLPLGTYQLTAEGVGYKTATNVVKLTESGRQPILQMEQEYKDARVTLTFVDQFGEPVTDGYVEVAASTPRRFSKSLDENGQVSFRASGDETYAYNLISGHYETKDVSGKIDPSEETRRTIEVERSVHQLRVYEKSLWPMKNAKVTIRRHADGATTTREITGGTAEFDVYTGTYTITVREDSADLERTETVKVTNDRDVRMPLNGNLSEDH